MALVLSFGLTLVACKGNNKKSGGGNSANALIESLDLDTIKNLSGDVTVTNDKNDNCDAYHVDMAMVDDKINADVYTYEKYMREGSNGEPSAKVTADAYIFRKNVAYYNEAIEVNDATKDNYVAKVKAALAQNPNGFLMEEDFNEMLDPDNTNDNYNAWVAMAYSLMTDNEDVKKAVTTYVQNMLKIYFNKSTTNGNTKILTFDPQGVVDMLWDNVYAAAGKIDENPKLSTLYNSAEFKAVWDVLFDGISGKQVQAILNGINDVMELPIEIRQASANESAYDYAKKYFDEDLDGVEIGDVKIQKILKELFGIDEMPDLTDTLDDVKDELDEYIDEINEMFGAELHFVNNKLSKVVASLNITNVKKSEDYDPETGEVVITEEDRTTYTYSVAVNVLDKAPTLVNTSTFRYKKLATTATITQNEHHGLIADEYSYVLDAMTVECYPDVERSRVKLYVTIDGESDYIAVADLEDGSVDGTFYYSIYTSHNIHLNFSTRECTGSGTVNGNVTTYNVTWTLRDDSNTIVGQFSVRYVMTETMEKM